jgi:proteasome lid subunit RPN8/RPN11
MHSTPPVRLALSKTHAAALTSAAENAYPSECCGLLVGQGDGVVTVTRVVPAANIADTPARRFLIDPQVQFDTLRALRNGPERVVGHYHSHPNGSAALSAHDLEMADDPDAIWVLIPVTDGRSGSLQAFRCADEQHAVPLVLEID